MFQVRCYTYAYDWARSFNTYAEASSYMRRATSRVLQQVTAEIVDTKRNRVLASAECNKGMRLKAA